MPVPSCHNPALLLCIAAFQLIIILSPLHPPAHLLDQARLREIRSLQGLLLEDISGGKERLPIPVINTVNDRHLPKDFVYTKDYTWAPYVERLVSGGAWWPQQVVRFLGEISMKARRNSLLTILPTVTKYNRL